MLTLCLMSNFLCYFILNTIKMSNSLDPDQIKRYEYIIEVRDICKANKIFVIIKAKLE